MKKLLILCMVGSFLSLFSGCELDDDGYSLDDAWIGFGLINKEADSQSFTIEMDDGEVLYPVTNSGYWNDFEDNDRVLTNFTILGNKENPDHNEYYYVKINSMRKILYKGILDITPAIEDSIGNDPIIVQEHWVSNNLLNLQLKYWGYNKTHFINLVKQPGTLTPANQPFEFELRHNKNGDDEAVSYVGFVSFKLDSLVFAGVDSVRFKVKSTDYHGNTIIFEEVFKYNENN